MQAKSKKKILIPFIDGLLNYDCRECGYSCCQMGNLLMNAKEKGLLLQKYPYLRYFFVHETKKIYNVRKYPRCWFLESNGLCYIQTKYGYSSKPLLCRLHPFRIIRCNDEYVMALERCPTLHVGTGGKDTTHKQILKNAEEAVYNDVISEEIDWPRWRVNLERKILEGSKIFLNNSNYLDFSAYQISIATENADMTKIKSELLKSVELWRSFLKIDGLNMENRRMTYELMALTSLLRIGNLYLRQMEVGKVPLALLALYFYMILFSKNRKIKTYLDTYEKILDDVSLGLLYLKKDDLNIRSRPTEDKLRYLRLLQKLHIRKLMSNVKDRKRNID